MIETQKKQHPDDVDLNEQDTYNFDEQREDQEIVSEHLGA